MGYEITYFYHERNEDGSYNTEVSKKAIKKVGKSHDDTPIEMVAKVILDQLARRDVWVVNVEITEFVKQKVSYKEARDGRGIVIKGKKFTVGTTSGIQVEEYEDANSVVNNAMISVQNKIIEGKMAEHRPVINPNRVIFQVLYTPEIHQIDSLKKYRLTVNKKYPVHLQVPSESGVGNTYWLTNDVNQQIEISELYFTVAPKGLMGDFNQELDDEFKPKLLYDGASRGGGRQPIRNMDRSMIPQEYAHLPIDGEEARYDNQVPDIRRKK